MFRIPTELKQISQLVSGNLITKLLSIAVLMVFTRLLTKQELAVIPLCQMLAGLAMVPFSFGIYPNLVKRLPSLLEKDLATARGMIFTGGSVVVGGSVIATAVVLVFRREVALAILNRAEYEPLIVWMAACFVPVTVSKLVNRILWAQGSFGSIACLDVMYAVIRPLATLALFFTFWLRGLVLGIAVASLAQSLVAVYLIRGLLVGGIPRLYPLSKLLRESLPFYLESYLMYFRREGDSWFVGTLVGPSSLAVYHIAKTLYTTFLTLQNSIDKVVVQRLAKAGEQSTRLARDVQTAFDAIAQTVIPSILLTIALLPSLITILGGAQYEDAVLPAALLLIAVMINFVRTPIQRAVFVGLPSSYRFLTVTLETICLFLALPLLGPAYGVIGIAASRIVAQVGGAICGYAILSGKLQIHPNLGVAGTALLIATATTGFVLSMQTPPETAVQSILCGVLSTLTWLSCFVGLTWLVDRDAVPRALQHFSIEDQR